MLFEKRVETRRVSHFLASKAFVHKRVHCKKSGSVWFGSSSGAQQIISMSFSLFCLKFGVLVLLYHNCTLYIWSPKIRKCLSPWMCCGHLDRNYPIDAMEMANSGLHCRLWFIPAGAPTIRIRSTTDPSRTEPNRTGRLYVPRDAARVESVGLGHVFSFFFWIFTRFTVSERWTNPPTIMGKMNRCFCPTFLPQWIETDLWRKVDCLRFLFSWQRLTKWWSKRYL